MGVSANGFGISFWGDDNVLEVENSNGHNLAKSKSHWIGYFDRVDVIVCEIYLNF